MTKKKVIKVIHYSLRLISHTLPRSPFTLIFSHKKPQKTLKSTQANIHLLRQNPRRLRSHHLRSHRSKPSRSSSSSSSFTIISTSHENHNLRNPLRHNPRPHRQKSSASTTVDSYNNNCSNGDVSVADALWKSHDVYCFECLTFILILQVDSFRRFRSRKRQRQFFVHRFKIEAGTGEFGSGLWIGWKAHHLFRPSKSIQQNRSSLKQLQSSTSKQNKI